MRAAALLLPCLLVGACSQPPAPKATSNEPNALPPGLWEVSRSVLSQRVGGAAAEVAMAPTPKGETHCLMEPVTKTSVIEYLMKIEGAACTPRQEIVHDGRISASFSCTPPPTHRSNEMSVTGTYTHERFSVEVEQKAVALPPGSDSQTRTAVDGRRIGEC